MAWLAEHLLTLNVAKTKLVTFSPTKASQPQIPILIRVHTCRYADKDTNCNCAKLNSIEFIRYLGITIDNNLKWKQQFCYTVAHLRNLICVKKHRDVVNFDSYINPFILYLRNRYWVTAW